MAFRRNEYRNAVETINNNENIGIMQNGINLKNNLSRNRPKQPLGNINNTFHNQINRKNFVKNGGDFECKKKELVQPKPKQIEISEIFQDNYFDDDTCSFKRTDDKSLEQTWLEEEFAESNIFNKIIDANKPRTKPISKDELDWIQFYEFEERSNETDLSRDLDLEKLLECSEEEIEVPKPCLDVEPLIDPPVDLFDDLDLPKIGNILPDNDNSNSGLGLLTPVIKSDFDDLFNF